MDWKLPLKNKAIALVTATTLCAGCVTYYDIDEGPSSFQKAFFDPDSIVPTAATGASVYRIIDSPSTDVWEHLNQIVESNGYDVLVQDEDSKFISIAISPKHWYSAIVQDYPDLRSMVAITANSEEISNKTNDSGTVTVVHTKGKPKYETENMIFEALMDATSKNAESN